MSIDTNKTFVATFDTSKGKIVVDLFPKEAPNTVNNFVFLARDKFYDGTKFHRVIDNFMIQGGDPEGTGRGGPGYRLRRVEPASRKHKVGSLQHGQRRPGTNGSQFFITHIVTDWLDGKHTVFGQVREGQDVVNAVKQGRHAEERDDRRRSRTPHLVVRRLNRLFVNRASDAGVATTGLS
jgi:peptidyl-prolyl cis-trans isomerase B (cyclophilin B)